jgi:glycosyltransferase involved in cell wall biosynthesis
VNVVVDARMAFHTGIGRYIRSLCHALLQQASGLHLALLLDPKTIQRARREIGPVEAIPFAASIYSLTEQLRGLRLYRGRAQQAALFHCPHYNIPWFLPPNSVVTIHDLTHFQFAQHFGKFRVNLAFRLLHRAVHRAGRLIAVSQATRHALETMIPAAKGKTTVIHHGVADPFCPLPGAAVEAFKRAHHLGRFFLFVGNAKPHKNLTQLLRAFTQVRRQSPQVELALLGVDPSCLSGTRDGMHVYPAVPEAQLIQWYNAAEALVLPSLNEGFGLPTLEAMACGTPVIGSNIAVLQEVVAEAGLLVDPWHVEALAQAMQGLLSNPDLRAALRAKGLVRAQHFTWTATAEQTYQVYNEVVNQCSRR